MVRVRLVRVRLVYVSLLRFRFFKEFYRTFNINHFCLAEVDGFLIPIIFLIKKNTFSGSIFYADDETDLSFSSERYSACFPSLISLFFKILTVVLFLVSLPLPYFFSPVTRPCCLSLVFCCSISCFTTRFHNHHVSILVTFHFTLLLVTLTFLPP